MLQGGRAQKELAVCGSIRPARTLQLYSHAYNLRQRSRAARDRSLARGHLVLRVCSAPQSVWPSNLL